jgi:hypothetical protein
MTHLEELEEEELEALRSKSETGTHRQEHSPR